MDYIIIIFPPYKFTDAELYEANVFAYSHFKNSLMIMN